MAATSEPASGSVSAKAAIAAPLAYPRQIARLEIVRSCKPNRTAAEALHHEGEIRQPAVACQRLPRYHQIERAQRIVGAAVACRHAMPEPAGDAECAHPANAGRVDVSMGGVPSFNFNHCLARPLVEFVGEGAVLRVKKRDAQMRGPAHNDSPPGVPGLKGFRGESASVAAPNVSLSNHCFLIAGGHTARRQPAPLWEKLDE